MALFLLPLGTVAAGAAVLRDAEPLQVVVAGVEGEARKNLETALAPPPGLSRDGRVDREWAEHYARQMSRQAEAALKPFGYYHAQVETRLEELAAGSYRLNVTIRPGAPVLVERLAVAVTGAGEKEGVLKEQLRAFPLHSGGVLRQDLYEQAKGRLKSLALELGYLDADFAVHRLGVDVERNRADVELTLETGEQYRFAAAVIHGAPAYPQPFLRRYLAFKEGEVFSYARLGQTQLNLLNSDRFSDVVITPHLELAEERRVPVGIRLVPSPRHRLRPGIGYGTDTGARASLTYKDVNLFERGHGFSTELNIAERRQSLTAEYLIPSYRMLSDHTALRTGYDREDLITYESRSLFVEAEQVRAFGGGRLASVYLRLQQEDFIIGVEDDRSRLLLPGVRFSERRYDDPVRPRRGYQYRAEVRGTHQGLGSDTGLLQTLGSANLILPLPAGFSFIGRGQGGATWQNEPLSEIPPSLRFFAGGDQSVRGYAFQTLGPRDRSGKVVGGKHLLVGSGELERAFSEDWGVVAFFDAGNAFDTFSDYRIFKGTGLGVRRYTPVGPIRIDLARQLSGPNPAFRLHLSIGFAW